MASRIVVIGLGGRGREWVHTVRAHPRFELAAGVDTDARALDAAAAALGLPREICFTRLDEALDRVRADAAIVATPIGHHGEPTRAVIDRGLGVLVEKPFTQGLAEAVQIVRRADAAKTPIVVGQNSRYLRVYRAIKEVLASGRLGRIGLVVQQIYRPEVMPPSVASMPDHMLWETAVHQLDAWRYVLGREATAVLADSYAPPWAPADAAPGSALHILAEFDGGIRAVFCGSYHVRGHEFFEHGRESYQRYVGERGTMHVFHRWIAVCERGRLPRFLRRGPRPHTEEHVLLDQLDGALGRGVEPESSGRDNLNTLALMEAVAVSGAERRWIRPRDLLDACS